MEKKINAIKIYRIENKFGKGPYSRNEFLINDFIAEHDDDYISHPNPCNDPKIGRYPEHDEICGFINKEQMLMWFTRSQLNSLLKIGFKIKHMVVSSITAYGKFQVLAKK